MNPNFDKIRCYNDEEVHDVLERLCNEKQFMKIMSTVYPFLPKEMIKTSVKHSYSIGFSERDYFTFCSISCC